MLDGIETSDLQKAEEILKRELARPDGCISLTTLGRFLVVEGLDDDRILRAFASLKLKAGSPDQTEKDLPWFYAPRSFYTKTEILKLRQNLDEKADEKAKETEGFSTSSGIEQSAGRTNRQDEAKLCAYVKNALTALYDRDTRTPEDVEFVFDVHNLRPDGIYRNVDVIAVDWADDQTVELVAVEVKLDFNPECVQQASFYQRFAHRCWVAVLVTDGRADQAWQAIQKRDSSLFEHAVSLGLGIMACFTSQGGGYRVVPMHWPKRQQPDPIEQKRFIKAYRETFEEAKVIPRNEDRKFPKVA